MIVLDASAAVDLILGVGAAERIAERVLRPGATLHAPHVLDVEVVHTLRRLVLRRELTPPRAREAVADLAGLQLTRYPHTPLLDRAWELRTNVSIFDAVYVALAEALEAIFVTSDGALSRTAGRMVTVELYR